MNPKDKKFNKGNWNKNRAQECDKGNGRNIQDLFLNYITENHTPVTVFLVCGVRLQGIITHHDVYTLLLKREGHTQLVFKHSISTIMPIDPIQFANNTDEADKDEENASEKGKTADEEVKENSVEEQE